ncbi:MAG: hypothetical protein ACK5ZS_00265 [bacterium]|jgi:hypothetical protein
MLKQSTARNLMVFLTDSTDHVTGKASATLTITISKDGGAFNSVSPTVTERGNGWYNVALTSSHTDTLGDFVLRATATGADPIDLRTQVVVGLPGESASNITAIKAKTDSLTFTVSGQVDANVQYVNDVQVAGTGALGNEWRPV